MISASDANKTAMQARYDIVYRIIEKAAIRGRIGVQILKGDAPVTQDILLDLREHGYDVCVFDSGTVNISWEDVS